MSDKEKTIIRVSSLAGWSDCQRRSATRSFYKRIIADGYELNRTNRSVAGSLGTGVHSGASFALQNKIEGKDTKISDMVDASVSSFETEAELGVEYDTTTESINTAQKQIESMCKAYYFGILPTIKPVEIETRMSAALTGEIIVSGQPDVTQTTKINELKTGRCGETYHAQLGGYSLLAKANKKNVPEFGIIDWMPRSRLSKPQPEPVKFIYPMALCEAEAKAALKEIQLKWEAYKESERPEVFANNTSSILCSPRYCSAYGTAWCEVSKTLTK